MKTAYLVEEILKQSVEGTVWVFFVAYGKMWEKGDTLRGNWNRKRWFWKSVACRDVKNTKLIDSLLENCAREKRLRVSL